MDNETHWETGVGVESHEGMTELIRAACDHDRVLAAVLVLLGETGVEFTVLAPPSLPLVEALESAIAGYRALVERVADGPPH